MNHSPDSCENCAILSEELTVAVLIVGREDGVIKYVNNRVARDLDLVHGKLIGAHYNEVFWPEFVSIYDGLVARCADGEKHHTIYYWAEKALWEQISAHTILWRSRPAVLLTITTVSEIARVDYKFEHLAYFDELLKLPNGDKLEHDINELASVETVVLIYFEIERFEDINNLYGWHNGNALLMQIRDWLLDHERNRSQLYRVNNGFAILGRKRTKEDAEEKAAEILQRFRQPWTLTAGGREHNLYTTVSLGIVHGKYVKNEMRNILVRTIRGMENNAAGYAVYDEEADERAKRSLRMRDSLIQCIHDGMKGFEVHYQPIMDLRQKSWVALEALCRWTMPEQGPVSPMEFIHVAEQLSLIGQVDGWVRRTAMRQCVELRLDEKHCVLDVNFSPTQAVGGDFIDELTAALRDTGFPASKLNLEITESARMVFDEQNMRGLKRLREKGVILSLDDFGTGYSSFENLINIPAKTLKTEKLFLDGIEEDAYRQYLLRMLVETAHYLGMRLVAEGVETEAQMELLVKYGVDYAQGYLFSRPLTAEQLQQEAWRFS